MLEFFEASIIHRGVNEIRATHEYGGTTESKVNRDKGTMLGELQYGMVCMIRMVYTVSNCQT